MRHALDLPGRWSSGRQATSSSWMTSLLYREPSAPQGASQMKLCEKHPRYGLTCKSYLAVKQTIK